MSDSSDAVTTLLVNIDVSDLGQAIEFYTTGLGLTVRRRPYPNIVELQGGSSPVFLTEKPAGTVPCPEAPRPEGAIREYAEARYIIMSDPFGHGFCLLQFKGSGYTSLRPTRPSERSRVGGSSDSSWPRDA